MTHLTMAVKLPSYLKAIKLTEELGLTTYLLGNLGNLTIVVICCLGQTELSLRGYLFGLEDNWGAKS